MKRLSGGEARRTAHGPRRSPPNPISCCSTNPPTISTSPALSGWKQSAVRHALRHRPDQPRPPIAGARYRAARDLARPRRHPACWISGFAQFETWRDQVLEQEESRTATNSAGKIKSCEEDWLRYGVTARRKRNVQKRLGDLARACAKKHKARSSGAARQGEAGRPPRPTGSGKPGHRSPKASAKAPTPTAPWCGIFRPACIRGGRDRDRRRTTAPARPRLLNMLTGKLAPDTGEVKPRHQPRRGRTRWTRRRAIPGPHPRPCRQRFDRRRRRHRHGGCARHEPPRGQLHEGFPVRAGTGQHRRSACSQAASVDSLTLAAALSQRPSNLMVLDEPTNDLDLETLELLQETSRRLHRHRAAGQP